MVKTYILAPNWTTAPPPDGPIQLGHVLDDLTEFVPLNRRSVPEIPEDDMNPVDTKTGFKTSRSELLSGELGVFARIFGLVGIGAGTGVFYEKDKSDVLTCKALDTVTFDPTPEYIAKSVNVPQVSRYMKLRRYKDPVYMITGLKIGRECSLQSSQNRSKGVKLDGGLNAPATPCQTGFEASLSTAARQGESWEGSTDFIVAFRVKKIWCHQGELRSRTHQDKAVMQNGGAVKAESAVVLMHDDDVTLDNVFIDKHLTTETEAENGEDVVWIVPKVDQDL
ncbi:Hypothetical protein NCS54_00183500 [Fusarium falciforme]|uniref:Hypothetical protein n=1 Tax=Fusarium falciforme TaxID=195108 RepID=UPI002300F760|nr:Hypothetical protein NCS54_00183500 [Fusarium falciforme]WAO84615.1 Hypothetical protein NCS54_00183500 [Fusarium falciforme]